MKQKIKKIISKFVFVVILSGVVVQPIQSFAAAPIMAALHKIAMLTAKGGTFLSILRADSFNQSVPLDMQDFGGVSFPTVSLEGKTITQAVTEITQEVVAPLAEEHGLTGAQERYLTKAVRAEVEGLFHKAKVDKKAFIKDALQFHREQIAIIEQNIRHRADQQQSVNIEKAAETLILLQRPGSKEALKQAYDIILNRFDACNSPNPIERVRARSSLSDLPNLLPASYDCWVGNAVLQLQERYLNKRGELINFAYDEHLAEAVNIFLEKPPFTLASYKQVLLNTKDATFKELYKRKFEQNGLQKIGSWLKETFVKPFSQNPMFGHGDVRSKVESLHKQALMKMIDCCERGNFYSAHCYATTPEMKGLVLQCQDYLCNECGVLKEFEHLPEWQNLPYQDKVLIGSDLKLQSLVNEGLVSGKIAPSDLILLVSEDSQGGDVPVLGFPSPSPSPDQDPDQEKKQESDVDVYEKRIETSSEVKELKRIIDDLKAKNFKEKVDTIYSLERTVQEIESLENKANKLYEIFRSSNLDIEKISKNTGIPKSYISRIKDHLFKQEHILDYGQDQFSVDPDIAFAWERLQSGNFAKSDLLLLQHEYAESLIMNGKKVSWRIAHDVVNRFYNWNQAVRV